MQTRPPLLHTCTPAALHYCFSHTPQAFAHLPKASNALPASPHHYYSSLFLDLGSSAPGSLSLRDPGTLWCHWPHLSLTPLDCEFSNHILVIFVPPAPTTKPVQKGTYMHIEFKKKEDRRETLVLKEKTQGRLVFANYPFKID